MTRTAIEMGLTNAVLQEVAEEREAQHAKWGEQNPPDGTGKPGDIDMANIAREACRVKFEQGEGTWSAILDEEFFEAMAESDPLLLRDELLQVAAVAVAWIEAIDRRGDLELKHAPFVTDEMIVNAPEGGWPELPRA